jgi:hypothetical protein
MDRKCPKCQGEMASKVVTVIDRFPGSLMGSGEVKHRTIWFCPDCDSEPPDTSYEDLSKDPF